MSIILEPDATEVTSSYPKSPGNRKSRQRTTNRRVRFSSEAEDEQVMDPKDNCVSDDPETSESPTRALPVRMQQTDTSDEGENPGGHHPSTVHTHDRSRGDNNIRSGLKNLLDANGQAPVVGANIAVVLETLLSQINEGGSKGLV